MQINTETLTGIQPFNIKATYAEIDSTSPENVFNSHIHEECEIYINISGDVSFAVEGQIYPIKPGSIIITKPYEYHHCIYHSNKLHRHFWFLISSNGNEELLDIFYKRNSGENNHLCLSPNDTETLISLCHQMTFPEKDEAEKYLRFFNLLHLLNKASTTTSPDVYPPDVVFAVNYINNNFSQHITIRELAKKSNVSINTLERHFSQVLNLSPSAYLKEKRLANGLKLLSEGYSVTEAAEGSGYTDYSAFISLFKKTYGMTPLKYKKRR